MYRGAAEKYADDPRIDAYKCDNVERFQDFKEALCEHFRTKDNFEDIKEVLLKMGFDIEKVPRPKNPKKIRFHLKESQP